jgi:hypothetical protein
MRCFASGETIVILHASMAPSTIGLVLWEAVFEASRAGAAAENA